jgi:serine phosphatase RsbU (regulator of sigma subunit)
MKLRVSREMSWQEEDANEDEDEEEKEERELSADIVPLLQRKSSSTKRVCTVQTDGMPRLLPVACSSPYA